MSEWLDLVSIEYLNGFIPAGGAAVKITVPATPGLPIAAALAERGREAGFVVAVVDAAETRADRIDQLFAAVARQVDWRQLAADVRERAIVESNYEIPDSRPWTFDSLAAAA